MFIVLKGTDGREMQVNTRHSAGTLSGSLFPRSLQLRRPFIPMIMHAAVAKPALLGTTAIF
jgi:hypothetical protein